MLLSNSLSQKFFAWMNFGNDYLFFFTNKTWNLIVFPVSDVPIVDYV